MKDPRNASYTTYKQTVNGIGKEEGEARYYNHIEELAEKSEEMNVYEYDIDSRYPDAAVSVAESGYKRDKTKHKKYIFKVTGKFSKTNSNG